MNVISAFSSVDFMPHGYCLQWNQWLLWLNAASDLLTAIAYYSIPLALFFLAEKRADFKYKRLLVLFAVFILLCGTTHLLAAVILWEPFYYLDTAVKMATAAVSAYTAVVLWPLLPELLALPSQSELEAADKKHRELASLLQSVLNAIPSSVFWKDAESRYLGCNSKHAAHVGLASPEEIVGKTDYDFFPPAFAEKYRADDLKTMQSGEGTIGYEEPYVGPNGDARHASTSKLPLVGLGNAVMGIVGAYDDITDRKKGEIELRKTQAILSALFNAIDESVFIMDAHGVVQAINKTGAARLGTAPADLIGNNIYSLIPPEVRTRRMELMTRCIMTGEAVRFKDRRGAIWFDQVLYPVKDESGNVYMIAVFAMDITDQVDAEEAIKRAMAELGRVNAELRDFLFVSSHDLQEPLRKIGGYIGLLKEHIGPAADDATRDYLDRMLGASLRMQALIVDLLELSRIITRARPFGKVDLGMIMRQVIDDLDIQVKECNAVIEAALDETIEADATQIRQLFQNLLGNALKFSKADARPVIRVSSSPNVEPLDILGIHYAIGEMVVIHFADNGIGFQPKYAEKIFGLFQRLHRRDQYEGTGVGLAICKKIVERHKGKIHAVGNLGEGALFTIYLPVRQCSTGESMGGLD